MGTPIPNGKQKAEEWPAEESAAEKWEEEWPAEESAAEEWEEEWPAEEAEEWQAERTKRKERK